jgi:hypothetical protein
MQMDSFKEDSETIADYPSDASPKVEGEAAEASDAILPDSLPDFLDNERKVKEAGKLDAAGGPSDTGATVASSDYNSYITDFSSDGYGALKPG